MKLSELVKLRNDLSNISLSEIKQAVDELDRKLSVADSVPSHNAYKTVLDNFIKMIDDIETSISTIESQIPDLIVDINQELVDRTTDFLARGYKIGDLPGSDSTDIETERTSRVSVMHDETRAEILVKSRKYTDWRFPVLEIGPGDGNWTEHLIAGDPLYLVDVHKEFIDSTLSKFNPVYRNRIRPYLIGQEADKSDTDLSMLPVNQFGFIFSWNVFDYFPLEHIAQFLKQGFDLLRPGGVMMFSYNNCDVEQCAKFAEEGFKSWMPRSLLVKTCIEHGFEIISTNSLENTVHWIEIKKPGKLKTVKAHQVMGEIIHL